MLCAASWARPKPSCIRKANATARSAVSQKVFAWEAAPRRANDRMICPTAKARFKVPGIGYSVESD